MASMDRKLIAKTQQYEVAYFAKKHRLSAADARSILQQAGAVERRPTNWPRRRKINHLPGSAEHGERDEDRQRVEDVFERTQVPRLWSVPDLLAGRSQEGYRSSQVVRGALTMAEMFFVQGVCR